MNRRFLHPVLLSALLACEEEAPARPQVLLHIDTDMTVLSQIESASSADLAIDSLRIEILDGNLEVLDARVVSISGSDLPLSIGIPSDVSDGGRVFARVRAFRAAFSTPGDLEGRPMLDPVAEVTVDRLVVLDLPSEGVVSRAVTLRGDCIGVGARFGIGGDEPQSCIDRERLMAPATEAIGEKIPLSSVSGTWKRPLERPCAAAAPPGSKCIPGGMSVLGDLNFLPLTELEYESIPLRVVELSPFYLDETEVTVGAVRALIAAGYTGPLPIPNAVDGDCNFDPATPDNFAVTCVPDEAADAICAARGGTVPTEAQWEHAARGRGERRLYSWGNEALQCCSASVARHPQSECGLGPLGAEPVGSHPGSDGCPGDVTRDGVLDMTGGVVELMRDSVADSFADDCWVPPVGGEQILIDPVCIGAIGRVGRGGSFLHGFVQAALPVRQMHLETGEDFGFRCAYAEAP